MSSKKKKTKICEGPASISQRIVSVEVGREKKAFSIHEELLCASSKYFTAALKGSFQEAQTGVVKLRHTRECTFKTAMHWLYTQTLSCDCEFCKSRSDVDIRTYCAIDVYIFADYHDIPALRMAAGDATHEHYSQSLRGCPTSHHVKHAFNKLPDSSPMRRMLLDLYVDRDIPYNDTEADVEARKSLPENFVRELATRLANRVHHKTYRTAAFSSDPSSYHKVISNNETKEKAQETSVKT